MKNFKEFINENSNIKVELKTLITNAGEFIDIEGTAEEGIGIYDKMGNEYPAGIDSEGILYAAMVDSDNKIFKTGDDGHVPGLVYGEIYT